MHSTDNVVQPFAVSLLRTATSTCEGLREQLAEETSALRQSHSKELDAVCRSQSILCFVMGFAGMLNIDFKKATRFCLLLLYQLKLTRIIVEL